MSFNIPTKNLYTGPGSPNTARVETMVIGKSDDSFVIVDHHLQIKMGGSVQEDTTFEGYEPNRFHFEVPASVITAPNTPVTYSVLNDMANVDQVAIAYAYITYPHSYDFENQSSFLFTVDNGDKYLEITNFNGGTAPVLYDLTNRQRWLPLFESATNTYKIHLKNVIGGAAKRTLFISSVDAATIQTVSSVEQRNFTNYEQAANQGDFILISHPQLMQGEVDEVQRYADYRRSLEGGQHKVVVANIEELYDQFAWGIAKHPLSIQNFINYVVDHWAAKPEYLLLLGKAVDYRTTRLNPQQYNYCLVPSYGNHPSDIMLAVRDVHTGYTPQLAVGRVPALTPDEVRKYLDKLIGHEAYNSCNKEEAYNYKQAIHLAGGNGFDEAELFASELEAYRHIYEDTSMGGKVIFTYKHETIDTVQASSVLGLEEVIDEGTQHHPLQRTLQWGLLECCVRPTDKLFEPR